MNKLISQDEIQHEFDERNLALLDAQLEMMAAIIDIILLVKPIAYIVMIIWVLMKTLEFLKQCVGFAFYINKQQQKIIKNYPLFQRKPNKLNFPAGQPLLK